MLSSESPASLGAAEVTPPPTAGRGGPVWLDAWSRLWPVALTSPRLPPGPGPTPPKPFLMGFSRSFVVSAGRSGVLWGQGGSGQESRGRVRCAFPAPEAWSASPGRRAGTDGPS